MLNKLGIRNRVELTRDAPRVNGDFAKRTSAVTR
jgi:hypothetical protein